MPHNTASLSYWERETFLSGIDVAIIGSGIVGLSAALHLHEAVPGLRILVLERGSLPLGASTRNAGFACFGSMTELLDDLSAQPPDAVWALVEQRWRGLQRLRERLGDAAIGYEPVGNWELFRHSEAREFEQCADHIDGFNRQLAHITGVPDTFSIDGAARQSTGFGGVAQLIKNRAEGLIHTGQMMAALLHKAQAAGIRILNGVTVTAMEAHIGDVQLETAAGWGFKADQVLVATNGFAQRLLPELDVQPARNQVLITEPVAHLPFRGGYHYDRGYYYFRHVGGRILLGGGRHLDKAGEQTDAFGHTPQIQEALLRLLREVVLPGQAVAPAYWWSGILGVGLEKRPIVRRTGPRMTVAVRMGGMGVAIGSLVGEEGAKLVLGGSAS